MTRKTEQIVRAALVGDETVSKAERAAALATLNGKTGTGKARPMTVREVCARLGVCPKTVYNYARAGHLKRVMASPDGIRARGFTAESVEAFARVRRG